VTFLGALTVASERLIEIVKGLFPSIDEKKDNVDDEAWRRATLHMLAAVAGCITAGLAYYAGVVPAAVSQNGWSMIALGLLASGGSGFWNSILDYLIGLKILKRLKPKRRWLKPMKK
jgi:hypothetical protein